MTTPEQLPQYPRNKEELKTELTRVGELLYLNEVNENVIERTANREKLLELQDSILDELDAHKQPGDSF